MSGTVEVHAAGAVLWRANDSVDGARNGSGVEIALVHRPRYDDWSLPKGKLLTGESIWAAAAREVAEETGFTATIGRHLGRVDYPVSTPLPAAKIVDYVAARVRSGRFEPNNEVDRLRWLSPDAALELLSYPHDKEIVTSFLAVPTDTVTLLLVRHAQAGSRKGWAGPDDERPLTRPGRRQAKAVRALLPLFGPDRVHSAPLLRCVQTVHGVAADLGVSIVTEPLLSEQCYVLDEKAAVDRLLEIAAGGGTPVVSSQGGVIPDLLVRLAEESGLVMDRPDSKKGSVWVLSFAGGARSRLVGAHYVPQP